MPEVKWIKIVTDIFDKPEIKHLKSLPDANEMIVFLFQLIFCAAKRGTGRLVFKISDSVEMTDSALSAVFCHDERLINKSIEIFEKAGIAERKAHCVEIYKFWVGARNRSSSHYKAWRSSVFERDNYTCMECGQKGGILNAHHIEKWSEYPSLRYELSNGITLCDECHKRLHKGGESIWLNGECLQRP